MKMTCYDIPSLLETPYVLYDISRLVRRARETAPTGIDRIDLQVAQSLSQAYGDRFLPIMRQGNTADLLAPWRLATFLQDLWSLWKGNEFKRASVTAQARALDRKSSRLLPRAYLIRKILTATGNARFTYVCCSHSGVISAGNLLSWLKNQISFQTLIYIHDLIPLDYPEYCRPEIVLHFKFMLKTFADLSPQYVVNSNYTRKRLDLWLSRNNYHISKKNIHIAPPLIDWIPSKDQLSNFKFNTPREPYFVTIGTIEPRKNHLLLLHIWRDWAQEERPDIPHLHIIGKRGWENENIVDMLERCAVIKPYVHEHNNMTQLEMVAMLKNARALLMPSFVEGLGLPIMEAKELGIVTLASDIPAFTEQRSNHTLQLCSPLSAESWKKKIIELNI